MNEKYCGLDVSNKSIAICVIDDEGKSVYESMVCMDGKELKKALRKYKNLSCVVEASPLAESISRIVESAGHRIDILDVRQAKIITKSKKKTDRLDAQKLAQLCRTRWYTRVHRKSGNARNIRSYLTARMQVVKAATGMYSNIRGLLRAHGIIIASGSGEKFERAVEVALKDADEMLQRAIRPLLALWRQLDEEGRRMYREVEKKIARKDPVITKLMTVPGVGAVTAAAFVSTIDDQRRFATAEQVASYLGLVPSVYQSGKTEIRGRITKHGDHLLRWLLVESATSLLCRTKEPCAIKTWGLRLQESKGFGKARVAVARKIACLLFHMWKNGQAFEAKLTA